MNKVYKILFALLLFVQLPYCVVAQRINSLDSVKSAIDYHLKLGMGIVSLGGNPEAYTFVAPSLSYQLTQKTKIRAGFSYLSNANGEIVLGQKDLSPRRTDRKIASAFVQAEYNGNDKFRFRGTMFIAGGNTGFKPLWGTSDKLSVFGGSADFSFKLLDDTALNLRFAFVRDKNGSLPPFFTDYMMLRNSYSSAWDFDIFANPNAFPMGF